MELFRISASFLLIKGFNGVVLNFWKFAVAIIVTRFFFYRHIIVTRFVHLLNTLYVSWFVENWGTVGHLYHSSSSIQVKFHVLAFSSLRQHRQPLLACQFVCLYYLHWVCETWSIDDFVPYHRAIVTISFAGCCQSHWRS